MGARFACVHKIVNLMSFFLLLWPTSLPPIMTSDPLRRLWLATTGVIPGGWGIYPPTFMNGVGGGVYKHPP